VTLPEVRISVPTPELDRLLARAENTIALIDRCSPTNLSSEIERVAARWACHGPVVPSWEYRAPADLAPILRALEHVAAGAHAGCPIAELYAGRARELWREARIVEALGTARFQEQAAARFPIDESRDGALADQAAREWATLARVEDGPRIAAEDPSDPRSLLSMLLGLVGALRLPVRVMVSVGLASAAATGDGVIVIRAGSTHREAGARRIALHEVYGHALPRSRARTEPLGILSVGSAGGADDEEGRALLLEQRHGLLDAERRRELGLRHLTARAVRLGADWVEAVRLAIDHGASIAEAVRLAARVCRGGGLARELVYLPAFHRVGRALDAEPSVEAWLERGRVAVSVARMLEQMQQPLPESITLPAPQANVATTGA